jgi:primosomal protein N' (replication factor Y)
VIQTYNPDHYAIKYAENHDYESFYKTEIEIRKLTGYTPINKMVQIILQDQDVSKVLKTGTKMVIDLRKELEDCIVLGPVLPKIARINSFFRGQIIIKYKESNNIDQVLQELYRKYTDEIVVAIDRNPTLL